MLLNKNQFIHNIVYIGYAICVFRYLFASNSIFILSNTINKFLIVIALLCFLMHILFMSFSKKVYIIFTFLFGLALAICVKTKEVECILLSLLILSLYKADYDRLIKAFITVYILGLFFTIIFSLVLNSNVVSYIPRTNNSDPVKRYMFGFSHPNSFHAAFVQLFAAFYILKGKRKFFKTRLLFLGLINLVLFIFTDSRTGFLTLSLMIILFFSYEYLNKIFCSKIFILCIYFAIPLIIFLVLLAAFNYTNLGLLSKIDTLLTGRIKLANMYLIYYPPCLLGLEIRNEIFSSVLDCGIISALIKFGVPYFIILTYIYIYGMFNIWKQRKYKEIIVVFCMIVFSISEDIYSKPFTNIGLTLCIYYCINQTVRNDMYRKKLTH